MKTKKLIYCEWAYVIGIILLAGGTALMECADFGMSMVVAPAYLLHLKISQYLPFFSFGMAEYIIQALLLILMGLLLRKFKLSYLGSIVTAILYGFLLDFMMRLVSFIPHNEIITRITCYSFGMLLCVIGIAFLFHTYFAPEAYELLVKELAQKYKWNISKVKTIYDCISCLVAIIMSFGFFGFGHFEGIKVGTIICALLNGTLIGLFSCMLDRQFIFKRRIKQKEE